MRAGSAVAKSLIAGYLAMVLTPIHGAPVTVTFEETGIPVPAIAVTPVSQIGDAIFTGLRVLDASNLFGSINLSVSSPNAAYFGPNDVVTLSLVDGALFEFESVYFGATHTDGAGFILQGWREGQPVYNGSATSPQLAPGLHTFGWADIDMLVMKSTPFLSGYNMADNLSYSVAQIPEPPQWLIMLTGIGLLVGAVRLRCLSSSAG
jgi:PPE-repeat protein